MKLMHIDKSDTSMKKKPILDFIKEPVTLNAKIMIVDDNIFNLATMSTLIKIKFGQEVIQVSNGQ